MMEPPTPLYIAAQQWQFEKFMSNFFVVPDINSKVFGGKIGGVVHWGPAWVDAEKKPLNPAKFSRDPKIR